MENIEKIEKIEKIEEIIKNIRICKICLDTDELTATFRHNRRALL